MVYDLIVVGLGPAGASAAIYAKRAGLKVLCFESKMIGGYLNYIDRVDNYIGLYGTTGPDFAFNIYGALKDLEIEVKNQEIVDILDGDIKTVVVNNDKFLCKNVIVATGRSPKKLGIDNEDKLLGKGISHCALCDGNFYKDKIVAVLGGGNSALQEALYLSNICKKIYLIHRRDEFRADRQTVDKTKSKENIEILMNVTIESLSESEGKLSEIKLTNGSKLIVNGLFIYIGFEPNTDFVKNLNIRNNKGYIEVDNNYETKVKGIYAVGDIIDKDVYQISVAVGEGTVAAINVIERINR